MVDAKKYVEEVKKNFSLESAKIVINYIKEMYFNHRVIESNFHEKYIDINHMPEKLYKEIDVNVLVEKFNLKELMYNISRLKTIFYSPSIVYKNRGSDTTDWLHHLSLIIHRIDEILKEYDDLKTNNIKKLIVYCNLYNLINYIAIEISALFNVN